MTGIALGAAFLAGAAAGWWASAAVAVGAVALCAASGLRRLILPALAVAVGAACGAWRGAPPPNLERPPWVDAAEAVLGRIATAPAVTGRSQSFVVAVDEVAIGDERVRGTARLCAFGPPYPELAVGDSVRLAGRVVPIDDAPVGLRAYLRSRGCSATINAFLVGVEEPGAGWRHAIAGASRHLSSVLQRAAPGDPGALLSGLVMGDDHALSRDRQEAFRRTGTTHLTAVSGANVALLTTVAATLGAATGWRRRLAWQLLTLAAVWGYAALAGFGPPSVRAALVATAAVFASRFGRRPDYVTLIVLSAAIMVAVEPSQLWLLAFQLSFAASLALAAVVPALAPIGVGGWLRAALLAVLAAQLATLPILLPITGTASLVAIPANLVVAPLVNVAFPLAALAAVAGIAWTPLGEVLLLPAELCAELVIGLVTGLAALPGVAPLGAVSRPMLLVVTFVAAGTVVALSAEGRSWARRLPTTLRGAPLHQRAALIGIVAGTAVVVVARWLA